MSRIRRWIAPMDSTYIFSWRGRHRWKFLSSRLWLQMVIDSHPSPTTSAWRGYAVKVGHVFVSSRTVPLTFVVQIWLVVILRNVIVRVEEFTETVLLSMWLTRIRALGMKHCVNPILLRRCFGLRKCSLPKPIRRASWRIPSILRTVVASNETRLLPGRLIWCATRLQGCFRDCRWHSPTSLVPCVHSGVRWK